MKNIRILRRTSPGADCAGPLRGQKQLSSAASRPADRGDFPWNISGDSTYLKPGDCLVINDTKVIPARLFGRKEDTGAVIGAAAVKEKGKRCLGDSGKTREEGESGYKADFWRRDFMRRDFGCG